MRDELELLHDRYGRSLFECAAEDGTVEAVMDQLGALNEEWLGDKEFRRLLKHPFITGSEKKNFLKELTARKKLCSTIFNFLKVLTDNRRESLIHGIFLRYSDLYDEFKNWIRVHVETPRPLTRDEKRFLSNMVSLKFKEKVNVELTVNPNLLSGVSIRYADMIYDYSVRSQLSRLERGLT